RGTRLIVRRPEVCLVSYVLHARRVSNPAYVHLERPGQPPGRSSFAHPNTTDLVRGSYRARAALRLRFALVSPAMTVPRLRPSSLAQASCASSSHRGRLTVPVHHRRASPCQFTLLPPPPSILTSPRNTSGQRVRNSANPARSSSSLRCTAQSSQMPVKMTC